MEWIEWHFDCEPEKNSGEGEPGESTGEQSGFSQIRQGREIESAFGEVDPEKGEEHRDTAEEGVEEKLGCGAIPIFSAPDFYEKESWDQAHLIEEEPENKILGSEG